MVQKGPKQAAMLQRRLLRRRQAAGPCSSCLAWHCLVWPVSSCLLWAPFRH
jgi:hypothetical protein